LIASSLQWCGALAALAFAFHAGIAAQSPPPSATVWRGAYTEEQAARGQNEYTKL
jgi:hypothetical protein